MKWKIFVVGKPALPFARAGVEEYLPRLRRYTTVEIQNLKECGPEANSKNLLQASEGCFRIVLDERGKSLTTAAFSKQIEKWELESMKRAAVIIGGADGHTDDIRAKADFLLRVSKFTLQHELALIVCLEQLYRCYSLSRGEPYHR